MSGLSGYAVNELGDGLNELAPAPGSAIDLAMDEFTSAPCAAVNLAVNEFAAAPGSA
jgi:hypothetical protein